MDALTKLGLSKGTKLLIIHADDAGLSHAENSATIAALKAGTVNSYSIMTTCPWFKEVADFALEKDEFDYGVHLTLTCEWKNYKWGPILSKTEVPSLVNSQGNFYSSRDDFKKHATAEDVKRELHAQIEKAYDLGLNPTHLDSHMYTLGLKSEFLEAYKEIGAEYKLPVFLNRQLIEDCGLNADQCLNERDFVIDNVVLGDYEVFKNGGLYDFYDSSLDKLVEGVNIVLIHPAFDTQEMQGVTIEHPNFGSEWRQIDYDYFTSQKCKQKIIDNGIQLITWKEIKSVLY
ncbi:chitin disaccharide deacetylase [Pontibacter saemangeumensis]|uniref:Chitin disaccharide deacetylase n=1 Tax=Pontibacter saemangeumensis TaxID=1084525 RepID=A0ABP8LLU0_9BACT